MEEVAIFNRQIKWVSLRRCDLRKEFKEVKVNPTGIFVEKRFHTGLGTTRRKALREDIPGANQ